MWLQRCVLAAFLLASASNLRAASTERSTAVLDTVLLDAARNDDFEAVRSALSKGANPDTSQPDGATALAWAAMRGNTSVVAALLDRKANPNAANVYGITPLAIAVQNNSSAVVELLLKAGTDPNLCRTSGESPLMTAARQGNVDVMRMLVAHGANVNSRDKKFGQTALMWAVGHPNAVRFLIDHGADIRTISTAFDVKTIMYGAVRSKLGRTGIPWDTDGEYVVKKGGYNALLFAAELNDLESAKVLIDAGLPVDSAAADGTTPLLRSLYKFDSSGKSLSASLPLARYLLQQGARVDVADQVGYTPLHAAVLLASRPAQRRVRNGGSQRLRQTEQQRADAVLLVKELLERGADPNKRTKYITTGVLGETRINAAPRGSSPMHLAADSGDSQLLKTMLDRGGDPSLPRHDGATPFLVAVQANDVASVKEFVAHHVNPDVTDAGGESVMHIAAAWQANRVIEYLFAQGIPLDGKDKAGKTPLAIAEEIEEFNAALFKENGRPVPPLTRDSTSKVIKRLLGQATPASSAATR